MKTFEIFSESKKKGQNGRRKFKVILYQIFPDSCIDEVNGVGTLYNDNGITWIREYCEKALPSIKGMSLRAEFLDDERTEMCGHGLTDIVDDVPVFEDAVVIGTFEKGYIDEVELSDGSKITACIGVGEIDSSCYHNFCQKLDEDIANGIYPSGSVEIMRTSENNGVVYKYGYKDLGRIPTEFIHSGYALLGVAPSDKTAKLVELNEIQKEDTDTMNKTEIEAIVAQVVTSMTNHTSELNQCQKDYEAQVSELNTVIENVTTEKNEAIADSETIKTALEECNKELDEKHKELDALYEELNELREELGKAKAKERVGELNAAIANFTDEEKEYAKAEIEAFNSNPVTSEINSVVTKIWEGIGRKAKEDAIVAEQNAAKQSVSIEDIFCAIDTVAETDSDINIF